MPTMLEDPTAPVIYRTSGAPPYPVPSDSSLPATIGPRQVTLRDRVTIATIMPFSTPSAIPERLLQYLCEVLNIEIEKGDTYPMTQAMSVPTFATYWFQNFGAVMLMGNVADAAQAARMEEEGARWEEVCLGSFYVKPNYPGRSSHVCNGGFMVTEAARNKGAGRLMGEIYLEWTPKLVRIPVPWACGAVLTDPLQGYTYSVFNLVYETNVVSCRIWDALGFKRIGRVKGCGNLRSNPDELVDAIIYGRDLGPDAEDYVSEERFDKIRYYLKHGKYPVGADRAEKSRLRSAATHYKLVPGDDGDEGEDSEKLMLKDKEVISDPQRQYGIARDLHAQQHGGINKTTAMIAEKYHWVRIKETVSLVIKNCPDCKDTQVRPPASRSATKYQTSTPRQQRAAPPDPSFIDQLLRFDNPTSQGAHGAPASNIRQSQQQHTAPVATMGSSEDYAGIPLDPQIVQSHQSTTPDFAEGLRKVAEFSRSIRPPETRMDTTMDLGDHQAHQHADTRMATERHVRQGDDPMAYQDSEGALHNLASNERQADVQMTDHFQVDQQGQ
ncbi:uncharacterized protein KY384_005752 [Bacidia gigantensis]|uniref:uncharacterized protein n=1 Tax=Bacidia gigantensis TaxID=2732470 RepID=UPI001D03DA28|nr:uncharacterized protein KY384_005752 [Bacidia gigantensis]KAG8529117.1 hypothetical protein KY384_005752 [Bacidia gigantensis]